MRFLGQIFLYTTLKILEIRQVFLPCLQKNLLLGTSQNRAGENFLRGQGKGSFAYWAYACHGVVWKAVRGRSIYEKFSLHGASIFDFCLPMEEMNSGTCEINA